MQSSTVERQLGRSLSGTHACVHVCPPRLQTWHFIHVNEQRKGIKPQGEGARSSRWRRTKPAHNAGYAAAPCCTSGTACIAADNGQPPPILPHTSSCLRAHPFISAVAEHLQFEWASAREHAPRIRPAVVDTNRSTFSGVWCAKTDVMAAVAASALVMLATSGIVHVTMWLLIACAVGSIAKVWMQAMVVGPTQLYNMRNGAKTICKQRACFKLTNQSYGIPARVATLGVQIRPPT